MTHKEIIELRRLVTIEIDHHSETGSIMYDEYDRCIGLIIRYLGESRHQKPRYLSFIFRTFEIRCRFVLSVIHEWLFNPSTDVSSWLDGHTVDVIFEMLADGFGKGNAQGCDFSHVRDSTDVAFEQMFVALMIRYGAFLHGMCITLEDGPYREFIAGEVAYYPFTEPEPELPKLSEIPDGEKPIPYKQYRIA